jgi:hypothetical protein
MSKLVREAVKAFEKAGIDVEVREDRKHTALYHDGDLIHTVSQGTKQTWRAEADLRRRIRRIQEGKTRRLDPRFHQD